MEIKHLNSSKNLHHHALPLVIIAIAVVIISTGFVSQQNTLSGNGTSLVSALFTRTLKVTPTSKGFARITLNDRSNEHVSSEINQAGRTTEIILSLEKHH